jgi:hypothetical protein
MPTEETNELMHADEATKIAIDKFMKFVNTAIKLAAKDGEYEVDIDNYDSQPKIRSKAVADAIELRLTCAGYHTESRFVDEYGGTYVFNISWEPGEVSQPIFPTKEEVEEAQRRFAVVQNDARQIRPVGQQSEPFAEYDRERFVRELKDANMLLSGWLDEETKMRNKIERLEFNQDWHKIGLYKHEQVVARLLDGDMVIGKLLDDGQFLVENAIVDNTDGHYFPTHIDIEDIESWKIAVPPKD